MLRPPEPVYVLDVIPAERVALLDLLGDLRPADWSRSTRVGDWTVHDIAAHLVGDDLGRLSRTRDRHRAPRGPSGQTLKELVDRLNREWVAAAYRLSPRVIRDLLEWTGPQLLEYFSRLDPLAMGEPVSWAGHAPAPVWLDIAREFTERWHHQQQIREAVQAPPLTKAGFLRPALHTFARALRPALGDESAMSGTCVTLVVDGVAGGSWTLVRDEDDWSLFEGVADQPTARVVLDEDTAWRMYVRALPVAEIRRRARIDGDERMGSRLLEAFALIS
jgi:uncharacterized protein (TIGR03083 family)